MNAAGAGTPERFPVYRLITGADDARFCDRVSETLALGYQLYGDPCIAAGPDGTVVGQALLWPLDSGPPPERP